MKTYYRPLAQTDLARPKQARALAGGWAWFDKVECLQRGRAGEIIAADELPAEILDALTQPRARIAGLAMNAPRLMGILNVTPDSFSDGGKFTHHERALSHANKMIKTGINIIDIGGESTRPGAEFVPADMEIARTEPMIATLCQNGKTPVSIDTRKAAVATAAIRAGASIVNDVSALSYDAQMIETVAKSQASLCLMHALGSPETMQDNPQYHDVLLDVYDHLSERVEFAVSHGIARSRIIVDPGIGFGKTPAHNLALIRGISLFHGLGCPVLLGSSRKKFIGTLTDEPDAAARMPGSVALSLFGVTQGVQISRVHDITETRQALTIWMAATGNG